MSQKKKGRWQKLLGRGKDKTSSLLLTCGPGVILTRKMMVSHNAVTLLVASEQLLSLQVSSPPVAFNLLCQLLCDCSKPQDRGTTEVL